MPQITASKMSASLSAWEDNQYGTTELAVLHESRYPEQEPIIPVN